MSSPLANPLTSVAAAPPPASSAPSASSLSSLADPNVFLQLLIAQLEHQDPESPADGTQFVTQLATFSQVDQSTQMLSDLDAIKAALTAPSATSANATGFSAAGLVNPPATANRTASATNS